ncbi:MAG: DUF1961 family protein [Chitinophagales bacterium]|nr:DUF1961 family protein [Chitinophagales bacterium]
MQLLLSVSMLAQEYQKGDLLYSNTFSKEEQSSGWVMEGAGKTEFKDGWMQMYSPDEAGHHVFWCPQDFPENFIAEWEAQNLETEAGLCIVFFAAKGLKGESLFDATLPKRNGSFTQYTKGAINNYHISYYANPKNEPEREIANLRKNRGFHKVQSDNPGIAVNSTAVHKLQLIKYGGRIILYIDERKVIDWTDDGESFGNILAGGKIGFRQMKWTRFAYRNFQVWDCAIIK